MQQNLSPQSCDVSESCQSEVHVVWVMYCVSSAGVFIGLNLNCAVLLVKVLSHPGHGNSKCCIVGNWHVSVSRRRFTSYPRGFRSSNQPEGSCRVLISVWESLTCFFIFIFFLKTMQEKMLDAKMLIYSYSVYFFYFFLFIFFHSLTLISASALKLQYRPGSAVYNLANFRWQLYCFC